MVQRTLDGGDAFGGVYESDPLRRLARAEDAEIDAWVRVSASCADKARAAVNKGEMAKARAWRHMAKVAANAREMQYVSWLKRTGRL